MKWTCVSMRAGGQDVPFAGEHFGRGADLQARRDAVHDAGVAGLADRRDAAVADADVGLVDAGAVDDDDVGDDQVGRAARRAWRVGDWPMPSRITLPPPNFASSP